MRVEAKLAEEPLRHRRESESWVAWSIECLAHTLAELEMAPDAWERHFGLRWPGIGYRKVMEVQKARLIREIKAETGEDVEC